MKESTRSTRRKAEEDQLGEPILPDDFAEDVESGPGETDEPVSEEPPEIPLEPVRVSSRQQAEELIEAEAIRRKELEREEQRRLRREFQWYLLCPSCNQPGIFFTDNPTGKIITPDMWYALYKGIEETWSEKTVYCQMCWKISGQWMELRVCPRQTTNKFGRSVLGAFTIPGPYQRFIGKIRREKALSSKPEEVAHD